MIDQTQRGPASDLLKATQLVNGSEQIQIHVFPPPHPALESEFAITVLHGFLE